MARLSHEPVTPRRSVSHSDSLADLGRLLSRLQQNILHADAERERRLRASEHERNKAGINLEYARSVLTKLEQDALAIKIHARRQEMQTDLNQKRAMYEQVAERLRELEEISIDSDEDDSDDGEDLLGDIIPTPSQSSDSRSSEHIRDAVRDSDTQDGDREGEGEGAVWAEDKDGNGNGNEDESAALIERLRTEPEPKPTPTEPLSSRPAPTATASSTQSHSQPPSYSHSQPPEPQPTGTTTSSTLRARGGPTATQQAPTTTTTPDTATTSALRSQLLGSGATAASATASTTTATAEAILDHHRAEQDKLTESMVSMAKALKESTHAFSSALREDQDVLDGAGKGLDRNERGLEGVAGRMGSLRRLTEGKGWWGRMLLYAWIAGLAVFAVLLVFVLPKLRF
ncbi:hypothetical protein F4777DRAFT_529908 [Nemania sp. FL0916]|nr:hypothetical protein F4777DRAFT_529908 [Nemania sp. FL0916]